jgi:XTP/dITP diphosphohydrolase
MLKLLIATRNAHKTAEIREILGLECEVTDLDGRPEILLPPETGDTFAENAAIKAVAASAHFDGLVLADDSGLEVDALGGAPGVRSARYAGEKASDAENRRKLLEALRGAGARGKGRSARFRCAMAAAKKGKILGTFEGAVEGVIVNRERGEGGFGYDSLFVPTGHCRTFGELPPEVKNEISHRARALRRFSSALSRLE